MASFVKFWEAVLNLDRCDNGGEELQDAQCNTQASRLTWMPLRSTTQSTISTDRSQLLDLPTELLFMILAEVEISPKIWLNLALTHSRIKDIVESKAFCKTINRHCVQAPIILSHNWSSNFTPRTAFANNREYHQIMLPTVAHFAAGLADRDLVSGMLIQIPPTFIDALTMGMSLLRHLTFLSHKLQAPSKKSINFMVDVLWDILPDQAIILLRYTILVMWYSSAQSELFWAQPKETDRLKGYGPSGVHTADPLGRSRPRKPYAEWLQGRCVRRYMAMETSLLFGPALNMPEAFCEKLLNPDRFTGAFFAFFQDTRHRVTRPQSVMKYCADGTPIHFNLLLRVIETRMHEIEADQTLRWYPWTWEKSERYWHVHKGARLRNMQKEIYSLAREIDFELLGTRLQKRVCEYLDMEDVPDPWAEPEDDTEDETGDDTADDTEGDTDD